MCRHERFEQSAMIGNPQVQQLMRDHEVLEPFRFIQQVDCECYGARA